MYCKTCDERLDPKTLMKDQDGYELPYYMQECINCNPFDGASLLEDSDLDFSTQGEE